jgi:hypothetical protein
MEDGMKTIKKANPEKDDLSNVFKKSPTLDGKGLHDLYRHATKLIK